MLSDMMGQSFKDCLLTLKCFNKKKKEVLYKQRGPVLITHWGLSGPAVLKLSAFAARELFANAYQAKLEVNWYPDKNEEELFSMLYSLQKKMHREKFMLQL